jgi:hypothetical protein
VSGAEARPRRRLTLAAAAIAAILAVLLAAYAYYYLTHIPAARVPKADDAITVPVGRELLLDGLRVGGVFTLDVRDAQQVRIELPPMAQLVAPSAAELAALPAVNQQGEPALGSRQLLTISMPEGSVAQIAFAVAGERPGLIFTPTRQIGNQQGFRVRMRSGRLTVGVQFRENHAGEGQMTLVNARTARRVSSVEFTIPEPVPKMAGSQVGESQWRALSQVNLSVLGLAGRAPAQTPEARLAAAPVELPIVPEDDPDDPRLAVGAVAVGRSDSGAFSFETIACAAEAGQTRLWRSLMPAIRLERCAPGGLLVDRFEPFASKLYAVEEGSAFFATGQGTDYWTGPSSVLGNSIISVIFGGIVGSLTAGAGLRIRRAFGVGSAAPEGEKAPARRRRRRPPRSD